MDAVLHFQGAERKGCVVMVPGLVMTNIAIVKMAIEIVSFPMKNGDFP